MRKLTNEQILAKVSKFIEQMSAAHEQEDVQTMIKDMERVMDEIDKFDRSLGPGHHIGRLVSWPQGDGQACYFVTKIGKGVVELAWLPWVDNWHSPVVVDGRALRPAVERAIKARDACRSIFSRPKVTSKNKR